MPGTELSEAAAKAEEIRSAIEGHVFEFEGRVIPVTSSFGVAQARYETDGETIEPVVKRADAHLYEAKKQGRNRVVSEMDGAGRASGKVLAVKQGTKIIFVKE